VGRHIYAVYQMIAAEVWQAGKIPRKLVQKPRLPEIAVFRLVKSFSAIAPEPGIPVGVDPAAFIRNGGQFRYHTALVINNNPQPSCSSTVAFRFPASGTRFADAFSAMIEPSAKINGN
jgi:hypothetical protein